MARASGLRRFRDGMAGIILELGYSSNEHSANAAGRCRSTLVPMTSNTHVLTPYRGGTHRRPGPGRAGFVRGRTVRPGSSPGSPVGAWKPTPQTRRFEALCFAAMAETRSRRGSTAARDLENGGDPIFRPLEFRSLAV